MRCGVCGTENRRERKFCAGCGHALALVCPACGTANIPGERFCGECGEPIPVPDAEAPVGGADPATQRPAGRQAPTGRAAERRLVSVLFADLVGSTAIAESRDPEEVRELLSAYFVAAREAIARHGGTVEKFIGDAVMAVWGAPTAHEDDAERAVRAALELVEAVTALRATTGIAELDARAAVLTGSVAVSLGAVGEGLVAGDLVNTAARLQGVAAPGTVLVGSETERATRGAIAYAPAGTHVMKGKSVPIEAWRALRVVGRGDPDAADRLEAPFVGRAMELRTLIEVLAATGSERRSRIVAISGQAGIGKSRLVRELQAHAVEQGMPLRWLHGRSPAYGDGIAYWAVGEMVRSQLGLLERDPAALTAERLAAALEEVVADPADRRWIEPHLRVLLGLDGPNSGDREDQFGAWRCYLEAVASHTPTVLVFEDLQWADEGLLAFIDSIVEWSRGWPILVLALARPELLERRPRFGASGRHGLALHLDPLAPGEMRALLAGVLPDLEPGRVEAVIARADGIPLYAMELVRMVRDMGAAGEAPTPDRLALPASVQALVAARLDAVPGDGRSLLQDAAVLGQSFTVPAVAAVSGLDAEDLEERLRDLVRREFLSLDTDPRSPERGQYHFVQSVVHEVAYGTLARRDRRSRHLAAARYVESLQDASTATVVASHYLEAYRAAPDDEQGRVIRVQARLALRAAADRSAQLHNHVDAIADLERCLELTDDPSDRAAIVVRQAELAVAGARYEDALTLADRARVAYEAIGDGRSALRAVALLGRIEMQRGRWAEAGTMLERSVAGLDPAAEPELYARLAAELARTHMVSDRNAEGLEWTERALAVAGPGRHLEIIAEAMATRGVCLQGLGRLDEATALLRASVELAAAHHLTETELRARYNLAGRLYPDDASAAIMVAQIGVEVARRTGRRDWLVTLTGGLAGTLLSTMELDAALETLALVPDEHRPPEDLAAAVVVRSIIAAVRGDRQAWPAGIVRARALVEHSNDQVAWEWAANSAGVAIMEGRLEDAVREASATRGSWWRAWGWVWTGRAALRAGDLGLARTALEAPELRAAVGGVFDVERLALTSGVAALEGRAADALSGYLEAARRVRLAGDRVLLADLAIDAIFVLGPEVPAVAELAEEASAILERAGARAMLDRLDEALAGPGWTNTPRGSEVALRSAP